MDVFIIDLDLTDGRLSSPHFDGIDICELARTNHRDAAIVIYSGHISRGAEKAFPDYARCLHAGADCVLSRPELFSYPRSELRELLTKWVRDRRASAGPRTRVYFSEELSTRAAKEDFGQELLEDLVLDCVGRDMLEVKVTAIEAGYSGAAVFRVHASQGARVSDLVRLIVKVARSSVALYEELERRPNPGTSIAWHSAIPSSGLHARGGVYAIAVPEIRGGLRLREYLLKARTRSDEKLLRGMVRALLVGPASTARPLVECGVEVNEFRLRLAMLHQIARWLESASGWSHLLRAADRQGLRAVQELVESMATGRWSFRADGCLGAYLHGDFHCRNVFVGRQSAGTVLDFGRASIYPRLFDFAALDVDLVISIMDCSDGRDLDWRRIPYWVRLVESGFPYGVGGMKDIASERWVLLRRIVQTEVEGLVPSVAPIEYAEVLLFHLMRYMRFGDVSSAKKLFAANLSALLIRKFGLIGSGGS